MTIMMMKMIDDNVTQCENVGNVGWNVGNGNVGKKWTEHLILHTIYLKKDEGILVYYTTYIIKEEIMEVCGNKRKTTWMLTLEELDCSKKKNVDFS